MNKTLTKNSFVRIVHDADGVASEICHRIASEKRRGQFVLCLGGTETSDIPGVSAAGKTPGERRLTPAADAEALILGRVISVPGVPQSPAGVIAPVVITRACTKLVPWNVTVVNCGTFHAPAIDSLQVGDVPAKCLSSGNAMSREVVEQLFDRGVAFARTIDEKLDYLVLSECVPGGTTTALAVLTACGYDADTLVSSSVVKMDHSLRNRLVQEGLRRADLDVAAVNRNPLLAFQAVGDPMQPFVAGVLVAVSKNIPVVLGGGSQMLAVHALANAIAKSRTQSDTGLGISCRATTLTTKWVVSDSGADVKTLSRLLETPLGCSCPDFSRSRHAGLRAYENGHVKEGVGAGAAMAIASLTGNFTETEIMSAIDDAYDEIV